MFTSQVHLVVSEVMAQMENSDTGGEDLQIKGVKMDRFEEVWQQIRKQYGYTSQLVNISSKNYKHLWIWLQIPVRLAHSGMLMLILKMINIYGYDYLVILATVCQLANISSEHFWISLKNSVRRLVRLTHASC